MDKHPLFVDDCSNADELDPLTEGLQQLKYDENENTADELATTYKEEGNLNFKKKNYEHAIINYEEGLKQKCSSDLKSQLYNNCAAAHFFLKNYRRCIQNSEMALKLDPGYIKAEIRLAQCFFEIEQYEECITTCDKVLSCDPSNVNIVTLKTKATSKKILKDRNERKAAVLKEMKEKEIDRLLKKLAEKNITIGCDKENITNIKQLEAHSCYLSKGIRVHLDGEILVWPVAFLFPEHHAMEVVEHFYENTTFREQLIEMFLTKAEWDVDKKYDTDHVRIYYTNFEIVTRIDLDDTLETVLADERFVVTGGGMLQFFIYSTESESEPELELLI